jgi:hypothetical protein
MAVVRQVWDSASTAIVNGATVAVNAGVLSSVVDVEALQCCGVMLTFRLGCSVATQGQWEIRILSRDGYDHQDVSNAEASDANGTPWLAFSLPLAARITSSNVVQKNFILPEPLPPEFCVRVDNKLSGTTSQVASIWYRTYSWRIE